ncbi:LysE family translocator [Lentibacter algarum]|uniref:LysE family translocator n=1 Tax=Lentibacter algarum TaxID=576131 RepID=UPI001C07DBD7|nr:LysE family translocator [Lentibacter algarum]MBU2980243.1 LysE family translocator [Lentibacter algarum]
MPNPDLLIAFFIAATIFAYMPGPAMLYTAAQTLARGRRAGWFAALGIHIGGYAHVLAAALGLAVLFQAVPSLYLALKFIGAAYLIWLGFKLFVSKAPTETSSLQIERKSPRRAFCDSIAVEVLNPKTALFYLAFLPQFTDPSASFPIWLQLLTLGTIVNFMFSSADVLCVLLADKVSTFLQGSQSAGRLAQKLGGSILIGLGLNVALNRS